LRLNFCSSEKQWQEENANTEDAKAAKDAEKHLKGDRLEH